MTDLAPSEKPLGTVMLIDDEQVDQMMYKRILKRSGLAGELISYTYAEEALDYLMHDATPSVDLILLDINMPRMTGFEFLKKAQDVLGPEFESSVVIMLTTSLNPQDRTMAESFASVKGYISKPLHLADVEGLARIVTKNRLH